MIKYCMINSTRLNVVKHLFYLSLESALVILRGGTDMRWPEFVQIKEVGPRDGLQNESEWISTDDKVTWINMLSESGISEIEYSSFVHPKWVPALKDAREVGRRIKRHPNTIYSALVPNEIGLERA